LLVYGGGFAVMQSCWSKYMDSALADLVGSLVTLALLAVRAIDRTSGFVVLSPVKRVLDVGGFKTPVPSLQMMGASVCQPSAPHRTSQQLTAKSSSLT
jgi:hypothetical protein